MAAFKTGLRSAFKSLRRYTRSTLEFRSRSFWLVESFRNNSIPSRAVAWIFSLISKFLLTYIDLMLKIPAFSKVKNDPIIHFLYDSTYTSSTPIRFSPRINLSANLKTHEVRNIRNFGLLPYLERIFTKMPSSRLDTWSKLSGRLRPCSRDGQTSFAYSKMPI